jgi:hypothetical protein
MFWVNLDDLRVFICMFVCLTEALTFTLDGDIAVKGSEALLGKPQSGWARCRASGAETSNILLLLNSLVAYPSSVVVGIRARECLKQ